MDALSCKDRCQLQCPLLGSARSINESTEQARQNVYGPVGTASLRHIEKAQQVIDSPESSESSRELAARSIANLKAVFEDIAQAQENMEIHAADQQKLADAALRACSNGPIINSSEEMVYCGSDLFDNPTPDNHGAPL